VKKQKLLDWIKEKKSKSYHMGGQVYEVLNELEDMVKREDEDGD
jgi:hypothetical protein